MFFVTGVSYQYGYGAADEEKFYHPVIAANEGAAMEKVRAYYEDRHKEVKNLKVFETIE
jgi:hypothetical protein